MGRARLAVAACVIAVAAVPASASARDFAGTALNIIPSGQYGSVPIPAGASRQANLYDGLTHLFGSVSTRDLALLSIMGIVQLGVGLLLMMVALRYLASAEIGLLSILEIIFGTLSVWVLIGERPTQAALIGGAIVIGALVANHIAGLRQTRPAPV